MKGLKRKADESDEESEQEKSEDDDHVDPYEVEI
jgi:hypothetical protein